MAKILALAGILTSLAWFALGGDEPVRAVDPSVSSLSEVTRIQALSHAVIENNPARTLILRVIDGDFELRRDIASGRFLKDFDSYAPALGEMDLDELRTISRTPYAARLEGPSIADTELRLWIRIVKKPDGWKVEDVRWVK